MPVDTENPNRGVEAGRPTFRSNKTELKIKQVRCRQKCHGAISFFERRKFGNLMKWFADGMDDLSLKQGLVLKAWAHMLVQLHTFTFSAMSHSHFASPGLSDGRTWYRVLWWLLHNMPCSGFQTPLETTGFVSSGAGPPLTPLAHLTTLYWVKQKLNLENNDDDDDNENHW